QLRLLRSLKDRKQENDKMIIF
uniref:Uncharacterized protein n=1 Tax=Panagrolaimus sp. ES5 TaxID=591445 RepID=A0AC34FDS8_9BILA